MKVKIINIKDNLITIEDANGRVKNLQVGSTAGIKIGMIAICEEDCGKMIRIGDKNIKVHRVFLPPKEIIK
jgi:hypothetical protein